MKIALIPARGGSKRIPRKNIKRFCGKPMIAWSIEAALNSKIFDHVIVSTEDEEISQVAQTYGAEVPFVRPLDLANDFTITKDVLDHAFNWLSLNRKVPSHICTIYATAAFITPQDIIQSFELLSEPGVEQSFTATSFPFPIQRAIRVKNNGAVEMLQSQYRTTRSQDLEPTYHDAGQLYWSTAKAITNNYDMFSEYSRILNLPRIRVQDIDSLEDWESAEILMQLLLNSEIN